MKTISEDLVTVIVVAYNESLYLPKCIPAILNQTHPHLELIVVDDGSHDGSEAIIRSFQDPRIQYIRNRENQGVARSRNIGLAAARGQFVFYTDADCTPSKNWIENGLAELKKSSEILAVEGATYYATAVTSSSDKITQNPDGGRYFTCNMGYRREILEKLNGFDERYKNYFEDTDLAQRIKKYGKIVFSPDAIVIHQRKKKDPKKLFREWSSRYEGLAQYYKATGKRFVVIHAEEYLLLIFPFLILLFYRIISLSDVKILPVIYAAMVVARFRLWVTAMKERVFYL